MTKDEARAAATKLLDANPNAIAMRSCWECNDCHGHLKRVDYIIRCFACGHIYYKGVDLTEGAPGAEGSDE